MIIVMNEIRLQKLKCLRCDHQWIPRIINIRVCPKCHSPYWNKPRKKNNDKTT